MQKKTRRRIGKPALIVLLILLLLVAGLLSFGPLVLEKVIIAQMRQAGLVRPQASVVRVTHRGLELHGISAQYPDFQVDLIHVGYTPASLFQGRVKEIVISGLKYRTDLGQTRSGADVVKSEAASGTGSRPEFPPELPALFFDRADIRSAVLEISYAGIRHLVYLDARLVAQNNRLLHFSADPWIYGIPVRIQGQADVAALTTSGRIRAFSNDFSQADPHSRVEKTRSPGEIPASGPGIAGTWSMDLHADNRAVFEIEALARGIDFSVPGLRAGLESGLFSAKALFDEQWKCREARAGLEIKGLLVNDVALDSFELSMREKGSEVSLAATLRRPLNASVHMQGTQSDFFEILQKRQWRISLDWRLQAGLDSRAASALLPVDLELEPAFDLDASGRLKAGFLPALQPKQGPVKNPGKWFADLQVQEAEIAPLRISVPSHFLAIRDLAFSGSGLLEASSAGWRVRVLEDTRLTAKTVVSGENEKKVQIQGLNWKNQPGRDFLSASLSDDGSASLSLAIFLENPYQCLFPGGALFGRTFALEGNASMAPGREQKAFLQARAKIDRIQTMSPEVEIQDVEMEIPIVYGQKSAEPGGFSVSRIRYGNMDLPAVTGRAIFRVQAGAGVLRPMLAPMVEIVIKDGRLDDTETGVEASGINGGAVIKELFPLTTPGNQRIAIKRLKVGELELEDGLIAFRLEPESFFLEKMRWRLPGGGALAADSCRLDFDPVKADAEVFFQDVDLVALVARLSQEKIVGSGRVYGRVPVQWQPERIDIGEGYLYSVPGAGRFGIRDEQWLDALMLYVRDAMAGHKYLSLVSERMEAALRDFEYHFLSINMKPGRQDTAARIELRGKGLRGESPQEVGSLVINVNSIEEILNRVLRFYQTKEQSIEKALDTFFDDSVGTAPELEK